MGPVPVIIVHGGAGSLASDEDRRLYLEGVTAAVDVGAAALGDGARAAVIAAVMHLESHSITNAGRGAALAEDGTAALDAGFMEGAGRRYGGVTGLRRTENAILVAAHLAAEGDFGRLVGPPTSDTLVSDAGATPCEPEQLVTDRARRLLAQRLSGQRPAAGSTPPLDTVGAVALDARGHLCAAVSTGGMSLKRPGRIGDSPVVGSGFWADDRFGACVTTGVGEALLRQGTARRAVQLMADGHDAPRAARLALEELSDGPDDQRGLSGLILLGTDGTPCLDHSSPEMSAGWRDAQGRGEVHHLWRGRAG